MNVSADVGITLNTIKKEKNGLRVAEVLEFIVIIFLAKLFHDFSTFTLTWKQAETIKIIKSRKNNL